MRQRRATGLPPPETTGGARILRKRSPSEHLVAVHHETLLCHAVNHAGGVSERRTRAITRAWRATLKKNSKEHLENRLNEAGRRIAELEEALPRHEAAEKEFESRIDRHMDAFLRAVSEKSSSRATGRMRRAGGR